MLLCLLLGGCAVPQPQDTPSPARRMVEETTGRAYWLYVPSNYTSERSWPLVITLHGASPWDSAKDQIREWKYLAERNGLIVAAPEIESAALHIVGRAGWQADLLKDEKAIMAILDSLESSYSITRHPPRGKLSRPGVLLTAFLEGGYALYHIGLGHPERFGALVARDCYSDQRTLEGLEITDDVRSLPIVIFNGKDGWGRLDTHGWRVYRYLRENRCFRAYRREVRGGQLRRPDRAYEYWLRYASSPPS